MALHSVFFCASFLGLIYIAPCHLAETKKKVSCWLTGITSVKSRVFMNMYVASKIFFQCCDPVKDIHDQQN